MSFRWWLPLLFSCASTASMLPAREPLWRDPDRQPFAGKPSSYYSPHDWDRIEKTFVLPTLDVLAVRVGGEAANVNAWDEVPDSSWFENRISRFPLSPEALADGPCGSPAPDLAGTWGIVEAKPDGATPGFVFDTASGQRYLAKFDGASGGPRASIAEVLGAGLYHAAGYHVPCNSIAYLDAGTLELAAGARAKNELGHDVPLTAVHLQAVLQRAQRLPDGRYRALVSRYLPGAPLGPWRYHGLRPGDRNDVVRHEDRRELRGARLLAAWTDHVDQREGNTLSMWRETAHGRGYVMHHLLDFGDCFGSIWAGPVQEVWRRGHDYWLDPGSILADWLTLGSAERPWDRARLGPTGLLLGYYEVEPFDPERWRPRYPNPAFSRMTERDAAWMARIIARIERPHLERLLDRAEAPLALRAELLRILLGRRQRVLQRYLLQLSPLADPTPQRGPSGDWLCVTDLAARAGVAPGTRPVGRVWSARAEAAPLAVRSAGAEHCVLLPELGPHGGARSAELVVELTQTAERRAAAALGVQLYRNGAGDWRVAGIERGVARAGNAVELGGRSRPGLAE